MTDQIMAALNRNYAILQAEADRERDARRRAEWADHRAELNRAYVATKRAAEDSGQPAYYGPPPEFDAPLWWFQTNPEPRTFVEPPTIPATGIGAPNHDGLGRYVQPAIETRTAEEQLADAQKRKGFWR